MGVLSISFLMRIRKQKKFDDPITFLVRKRSEKTTETSEKNTILELSKQAYFLGMPLSGGPRTVSEYTLVQYKTFVKAIF